MFNRFFAKPEPAMRGSGCSIGSRRMLLRISCLYFFPVDNLPQCIQVCGTLVLVVQVIGMFPDVKGEDGFKAVGYGIVGVGVLGYGEFAGSIDLEPDPAGAKEACALGFEIGLEGIEGAPLLLNLRQEFARRGR